MNCRKMRLTSLLLLIAVVLSTPGAAHGDGTEYCDHIDEHLGTNKDAGETPEDARDFLYRCTGHLQMDVDEVDLLKDRVAKPGGTPMAYTIYHDDDGICNCGYQSTLSFRLLWISADAVEVLDEVTMEHRGSGRLEGTVPDGLDLDARAYIEITLVSAENDREYGYTVYRAA